MVSYSNMFGWNVHKRKRRMLEVSWFARRLFSYVVVLCKGEKNSFKSRHITFNHCFGGKRREEKQQPMRSRKKNPSLEHPNSSSHHPIPSWSFCYPLRRLPSGDQRQVWWSWSAAVVTKANHQHELPENENLCPSQESKICDEYPAFMGGRNGGRAEAKKRSFCLLASLWCIWMQPNSGNGC